MKNTYILILNIFILAGLFSCSHDEFLKEEPQGMFAAYGSLKTEADAIAAVNGVYYSLADKNAFRDIGGIREFTFGTSEAKGGFNLFRWNFDASHAAIRNTWTALYNGINQSNWTIDVVSKMGDDAGFKTYIGADGNEYTTRDRIIGEAKFLRALAYFYAVNIWGEIPLVTAPFTDATQDFYVSQTDTGTIYRELIIKDLEECANILPNRSQYSGDNLYRASSGAALGVLAKVHLFLGDYNKFSPTGSNISAANDHYAKAMQYAEAVINSGEYSLMADYRECLSTLRENNQEILFAFPHDGETNYTQVAARTIPPDDEPLGVNSPPWRGGRMIIEKIVRRAPFDYRRWASIYYATGNKKGFYITKYWDPLNVPTFNKTGNDFVILRLAELYIIYADASNELNEIATAQAAEYLCTVRKRGARFFGNKADGQSYTHEQEYFAFGTEFTPSGILEFQETKDKPNNSKLPIIVDYSDVDLNAGVPSASGGSATKRPGVDKINLYYNDPAMLTGMDYAQFSNEIWLDYEYELLWEGTRSFDYLRKRKLETLYLVNTRVKEGQLNEMHYLFPKPSTEIIANENLKQNFGW